MSVLYRLAATRTQREVIIPSCYPTISALIYRIHFLIRLSNLLNGLSLAFGGKLLALLDKKYMVSF